MYITDLNGRLIEVTDLDKAIQVTAEYKQYRHKDKTYAEFDKRQKTYWADMYDKLIAIKKQETTH